MYCIQCGVKLADSEQRCPLCHTEVFHPHLTREAGEKLYPEGKLPQERRRSWVPQIVLGLLFLTPMWVVLLVDHQINSAVTWSGYVVGALLVIYAGLGLPVWFRKPNPVIFVPCWFAALAAYLMYINFTVDGNWLLTFAMPVTGAFGLVVTAVVALVRYLKKGHLFVYGGALILLGALVPCAEILADYVFEVPGFFGWSLYPLIPLVLLGGFLIFLGIYAPAREAVERKLFL